MVRDPITEEIRESRRRLAAQFENDVYQIAEDVRRREIASGRTVVNLSKRLPPTVDAVLLAPHADGGIR